MKVCGEFPESRTRDIRVLLNAKDHTVNRDAIDELVLHWSAKGGQVTVYELAASLGLPHDMLDRQIPSARTGVIDLVLLNLIAGRELPSRTAARRRPR